MEWWIDGVMDSWWDYAADSMLYLVAAKTQRKLRGL
jgi:hypothetical protein